MTDSQEELAANQVPVTPSSAKPKIKPPPVPAKQPPPKPMSEKKPESPLVDSDDSAFWKTLGQ